jgi:hypothetical protein
MTTVFSPYSNSNSALRHFPYFSGLAEYSESAFFFYTAAVASVYTNMGNAIAA